MGYDAEPLPSTLPPGGWGFLLPTRPRKSCMMRWLLIVLLMLCTLLVTASHIADIPHLPCGFYEYLMS